MTTTKNRDVALDDVSIPQPKPSASKLSVPVLHSLTLNQLEATRGYCETVASVSRLHTNGNARECPPEPSEVAAVQVELDRAVHGHDGDSSPYGDGVRYALSTARVVDQLQEVEAMLLGWKR